MTISYWLVIFILISIGNGDNLDNIDEEALFFDSSLVNSSAKGDCSNKHVLCGFWARAGECMTSRKFMSDYCLGSCDPQCNGKTKIADNNIECTNYIQYCQFWASKGECENNPTYMLWQCPKECHTKCSKSSKSSSSVNETEKGTSGSNPSQVKFSIKKSGGSQSGKQNNNSSNQGVLKKAESEKTFTDDKFQLPQRRIRPDGELKTQGTVNLKLQGKNVVHKMTRIPKVLKSTTIWPHSSKKLTTLVSKSTTMKRKSSIFTVQPPTGGEDVSPLVPIHITFTDEQLEKSKPLNVKFSKQTGGRAKLKGYKLRHRSVQQINTNQKKSRIVQLSNIQRSNNKDERSHLLKERE